MAGTDYSAYHLGTDVPAPEDDSALLQLVVPTGHGQSVDRPWRGIVTGDGWKYVVLEGQPWLMFNLNDDPYEQVNLAHNTNFATKRRALQDRLDERIRVVGDRFAMPEL
jgi:arylsulfatase A-like enzyme